MELGLDWQKLTWQFDDLGARWLQIGVLEYHRKEREFTISASWIADWRSGKRDVKIILAIGMRVRSDTGMSYSDWAKESSFSNSPFVRLQSEQLASIFADNNRALS